MTLIKDKKAIKPYPIQEDDIKIWEDGAQLYLIDFKFEKQPEKKKKIQKVTLNGHDQTTSMEVNGQYMVKVFRHSTVL